MRFADCYTNDGTAIASTFDPPTATPVQSSDTQTYGLTTGQMMAFAFRDSLRSYIYYDPNHAGDLSNYTCYWVPGDDGSDTAQTPAATNDITLGGEGQPLAYPIQATYWLSGSTWSPHGNYLFCGVDNANGNPGKFTWFDKGETLYITCTAQDADFDVTLEQWQANGVATAQTVTVPATFKGKHPGVHKGDNNSSPGTAHSASVVILKEGYYRLLCMNPIASITSANVIGNLQFYKTNAGPSWGHHCIPFYDTKAGIAPSIRVSAVSMMLSNSSNYLNKAGTITGYQSDKGTPWGDYAFGTTPIPVSTASGSKKITVEKGMFAWLRPTDRNNFDPLNYVQANAAGTIVGSAFPLLPKHPYLMMKADLGGSDNVANFSGYWTFAFGTEFKTRDQFFNLETPENTSQLYDLAASQLKNAPQFSENPSHFMRLFKAVRNAARSVVHGIVDWGPQIYTAANAMLPLVGA